MKTLSKILSLKKIDLFVIGFLLVFSTVLLTIDITKPLNGHHDYNNRYLSEVVTNYLKFGPLPLRFGQFIGQISFPPDFTSAYTHHPIGVPLLLVPFIALGGPTPLAIRLLPTLFSLLTVCLFYLVLRRFFSTRASVLALIFWITTPMFLYFGKMTDHEVPTLFFIILTLQAYLRKNSRLLFLSLALGQWMGWPAYYLAGLLFLVTFDWRLVLLSLTNFSIFLLHTFWLTGSVVGGGLLEIFLFRAGLGQLDWVVENYTWVQWLTQELRWLYRFFTPPQFIVVVLTVIYTALSVTTRKLTLSKANLIWLTFAGIATIHIFLFRTGAWRHDYWLYYFLPFFSFGIATAISHLEKKFPRQTTVITLLFLVFVLLGVYISEPFFWALQTMVVN